MTEQEQPLTSLIPASTAEEKALDLASDRVLDASWFTPLTVGTGSGSGVGAANKGKWIFGEHVLSENPVRIVAIKRHFHAMLQQRQEKTQESYDPTSKITTFIKSVQQDKTKTYPAYDARVGIEFLVYIPSTNAWGVYWPNKFQQVNRGGSQIVIKQHMTPIAERDSDAAKAMPQTNIFDLEIHILKQGSYEAPTAKATPVLDCNIAPPNQEDLLAMLQKFDALVVADYIRDSDTADAASPASEER